MAICPMSVWTGEHSTTPEGYVRSVYRPCTEPAAMRRLDEITDHGVTAWSVRFMCTSCWEQGEGRCAYWRPIGTPEDWNDDTQVLRVNVQQAMAQLVGAIDRMAHRDGFERRRAGRHVRR